MTLTSLRLVKEILAKHGIRPSKGLGQNFLIDRGAIRKLVAASSIQSNDTILEIGPGIGTLTQELAQLAKKVISVEKDAKMIEILRETLSEFKNIEIIHGDALKSNYKLPATNYKLVSNLPYYITAPTIRKFLEASKAKPYSMTLIVQKEVAQRICAKPPKMSILAASVQVYATPKIISYIKKTAFWPKPKVDAAILQITPFPQPYSIDFPKFFTVVKAGFKQPRKQLVNNLSAGFGLSREKTEQWLCSNDIEPARRAETLSVQDWINLTNTL
ncbi:MAG: ribosomal RNA small subunit methyltransferase A [Candidatus Wildermuthbacteria bacterium RIFCSPLOWO2_01_FULL_48_29]|uniref:Ribosomal RNA small subunit methyltransferase A n=2 Tax=Candidatus Wildermuthiibacteriota TaxID=1817923 RepID=A0A1G2RMF6_9BACT|nr:MAG: ribosomal RNA small subunit methyltransferase A [Candidatus Wildermuthbacteria bacterium RIFCSPHIGHO2_01_FULL_48_27b]OHA74007.1 MAG: ribosomal RNA small subunit methyltransferase A [Candidatus Wildermuthbacteria bacterium RIFCSPLOWO2_01_FULL_48_29]